MSFSFLHSVESNIALFSEALEGTNLVPEAHHVRNDLLQKVTELGYIDADIGAEIERAILECARGVDLLLVTCSTLSPIADRLMVEGAPVIRTDRLLADALFKNAMSNPGRVDIAILITAPSTVDATAGLFKTCRDVTGAESIGVETILLPDIWDIFLSGDLEGYKQACITAMDDFLLNDKKFTHVGVGQVSMAPSLAYCTSPRAQHVWSALSATRTYLLHHYR
ncbi:hypothetical protein [uncultured Cohaesibacter sp.]|uniref:hypothetical protein n=1 Tax=uncultured Cohaesibacter sp. TaxID=1002546 RepID=UPI00292E2DD8|nr:hypothetical protein [uncultured Cohaesibacter sp.]